MSRKGAHICARLGTPASLNLMEGLAVAVARSRGKGCHGDGSMWFKAGQGVSGRPHLPEFLRLRNLPGTMPRPFCSCAAVPVPGVGTPAGAANRGHGIRKGEGMREMRDSGLRQLYGIIALLFVTLAAMLVWIYWPLKGR